MTQDSRPLIDRLSYALREQEDVRLAFLFGSRAQERARSDSDFDIGVLLNASAAREDHGIIIRRLAGRLGREGPPRCSIWSS